MAGYDSEMNYQQAQMMDTARKMGQLRMPSTTTGSYADRLSAGADLKTLAADITRDRRANAAKLTAPGSGVRGGTTESRYEDLKGTIVGDRKKDTRMIGRRGPVFNYQKSLVDGIRRNEELDTLINELDGTNMDAKGGRTRRTKKRIRRDPKALKRGKSVCRK